MSDLKNPYQAAGYGEHVRNAWDEGAAAERARIVAWLRWLPLSDVELQYPEALANHLESGAHVKDGK